MEAAVGFEKLAKGAQANITSTPKKPYAAFFTVCLIYFSAFLRSYHYPRGLCYTLPGIRGSSRGKIFMPIMAEAISHIF